MVAKFTQLIFRQLQDHEIRPYDLFLLADPSKMIIDEYLTTSKIYIAELHEKTVGTVVVQNLNNNVAEIKNIVVSFGHRDRGIGTFLIQNVIQEARLMNLQSLLIGTANSSIGQLYLYQKLGFDIVEIKRNFFIDNYTEEIHENGIQAKHMIMLANKLN